MMDASRPTPIAIQSKPMWIAAYRSSLIIDDDNVEFGHIPSDIRPRLFVQTPYNICTTM